MDPSRFVHLHVLSHYSLGEGASSVERLARTAAAHGYKALALTDRHSLAGMVRFVRACRAHGIRPLVGCEFLVRSGLGTDEGDSASNGDRKSASRRPAVPPGGKLVFLAQSELGYRQLVRMAGLAHANADATRSHQEPDTDANGDSPNATAILPYLTLDQVGELARDVVVLTGGVEGDLWRIAMHGNIGGAEVWLRRLAGLLGRENLVIELVNDGRPREERTCRLLASLGRSLDIPYIATNEVRYAAPGEDILLQFLRGTQIDGRRTVGDITGETWSSNRHLAGFQEMAERFSEIPEALEATREIADRCEFFLPSPKRRFPTHDFQRGLDAESFLWDAVFRRATQRYGDLSSTLKDRLNREFDNLRQADLCNALVFLCRLNEELDRRGVIRGPGSGPLATSLVAAVLGLTRFDPLRHGLEYEPPRNENEPFPVFGLEVATGQTETVLDALHAVYQSAQISGVGRWDRWKLGELLDALAAWTGLPTQRVPQILDSEEWREAVAREEGRPESRPLSPESRLRSPEVFAYIVRRLEGTPRELTSVPGQFLLTVENLTNAVACESVAEVSLPVSQVEGDDLDALHLARMEVRHHPLLDVIERATAWIRLQHDPEFQADRVPAEDPKAYQLLAEGWTMGITPLESPTAKSFLRGRRPSHIDELASIIAELSVVRRHGSRTRAPQIDPGEILTTALLCHICSWIKAHHPAAFYAATLSQFFPYRRRFRSIWREAKLRGLTLLPPDINLSDWDFSHEGRNTVRCGLMVVGGLGRRAFREISHNRRGMAFFDLTDLTRRTDSKRLRVSQLENLIRSGSCDSFGSSRAKMLRQLPMVLGVARPRETGITPREPLMFFDRPTNEWISEMSGETDNPNEPPEPMAQRLALEQQAAGFTVTADSLDLFADLLATMNAMFPWQISSRHEGKSVRLAGYLEGIERAGPLVRGDVVAILDLSGCLVHVPQAIKSDLGSLSLIAGPVVVTGILERQNFEWRLRAESIQSLETIWIHASSADRFVLDLRNADRRILRTVIRILKQYPGRVAVEATGTGSEPKRMMAQIGKMTVLPCPPLEEELRELLGPDRLSTRRREGVNLVPAAAEGSG